MSNVTITSLVSVDFDNLIVREVDANLPEAKSPDFDGNLCFLVYVNAHVDSGWYVFDGDRFFERDNLRPHDFSQKYVEYIRNYISEWLGGL